jgi:hypothetical protein
LRTLIIASLPAEVFPPEDPDIQRQLRSKYALERDKAMSAF